MFSQASDEVIEIAEEIIEAHHPWLAQARIGFLFREEAPKSKGKYTLAQASKVAPKYSPFVPYDFLIWVAEDTWDEFDHETRRALIDHELCHCGGSLAEGFYIAPHNIEEFDAILARHGLWSASLLNARYSMQLSLDFGNEVPEPISEGGVSAPEPDKADLFEWQKSYSE